jgi:ferrochelatase
MGENLLINRAYMGESPPNDRAAVLLLAYGGPDSLEDIPAYLSDIRGGRPTPQFLVDEISERYRLIGGRSPLLEITNRVARRLEQRINLPVYVGMRHWQPRIEEVVSRIASSDLERLVAICMAPHYSDLSIGRYRQKLDAALSAAGRDIQVDFIESWGAQPDYLAGLAANISSTLQRWPEEGHQQVTVVFTAHSLPESILERGDPYDDQLRQTAMLLAKALDLPASGWTFSYQSAAKTGVPWLGPQIEDLVVELAGEGRRDLLVAPIGFIADHVEVLYDLDIGLQEIARRHGVRLERTPMLNDSDPLIEALADLAQSTLAFDPNLLGER